MDEKRILEDNLRCSDTASSLLLYIDMEKQVNGLVCLRQVPQNKSIVKKDKKTPCFAITNHLIF